MARIGLKLAAVCGVCIALAVPVGGCAPPAIHPPAIREAANYSAKASRAGLTIAADTYADPEKSKAVFGVDLVSKDVLAVNLVFENSGRKKFFVYSNQISFEDANGEKHPRLQVSQVAAAVEGKGFAGGKGTGGVSVGVVGISGQPRPSVAQAYLEVSLAGNVLTPSSRAYGFVFFGLGKDRLVTGDVIVPIHDTDEDRILVFEIPVP